MPEYPEEFYTSDELHAFHMDALYQRSGGAMGYKMSAEYRQTVNRMAAQRCIEAQNKPIEKPKKGKVQ